MDFQVKQTYNDKSFLLRSAEAISIGFIWENPVRTAKAKTKARKAISPAIRGEKVIIKEIRKNQEAGMAERTIPATKVRRDFEYSCEMHRRQKEMASGIGPLKVVRIEKRTYAEMRTIDPCLYFESPSTKEERKTISDIPLMNLEKAPANLYHLVSYARDRGIVRGNYYPGPVFSGLNYAPQHRDLRIRIYADCWLI